MNEVTTRQHIDFSSHSPSRDMPNNLGLMYAKAQGVPQAYVPAYMWFDVAASTSIKDI